MSAAPVIVKSIRIAMSVTSGPGAGHEFLFEKNVISVGRGPENDLVLASDVKVSRKHFEIRIQNGIVRTVNLNERNALAVDGEIVSEKELRPGAILRFGDSEVIVNFEAPKALSPVRSASHQAPQAPVKSGSTPQTYQPPRSSAESPAHFESRPAELSSSGFNRFHLYVLVALVLGVAGYLAQETAKKRAHVKLRDSAAIQTAIQGSQEATEKLITESEKRGEETIQYKTAQEQYLRGFRDYRLGQYGRAIESFRAALSFYPQHALAQKYLNLSKKRFDEMVQWNMIQGRRYYGVQNYRLCMSYYATVIKMKKEDADPVRREALQYYQECEVRMKGKY